MKIANLKGTTDYYNEDMKLRRKIEDVLRRNFLKYGFNEASTPILNSMELLSWKYGGGSEILKEVYQLSDQAGRELGLRYDLTVPFAKMVSLNQNIKMPYRRFEIGRVFRNGPVKTGRLREFIQADVDIVGLDSIWSELEFLMMIKDIFEELNINIVIQLNDRMLLFAMLNLVGINEGLWSKVILILDKFQKLKEEELISQLVDIGVNQEDGQYLLRLCRMSLEELEQRINVGVSDIEIIEGVKRFKQVYELISEFGFAESIELNPGLARGLEVYTGTIWEVFAVGSSVNSSIAAGGRYDKLIESFINNTRKYPAIGMTFGLDVIYTVMKEKIDDDEWLNLYYIIPFPGCEIEAIKIANKLRLKGKNVVVEVRGTKIGKAMNYANKLKYRYVIVIGEDEVKDSIYKVKNMESGEYWN